jgi:hypothetical protein
VVQGLIHVVGVWICGPDIYVCVLSVVILCDVKVDGPAGPDGTSTKIEYRVWNPFRSKLAAAILGGTNPLPTFFPSHLPPLVCFLMAFSPLSPS